MTNTGPKDVWNSGNLYEPYVGRWSRLVADEFLHWLPAGKARDWLDVGCGTGALSEAILTSCDPQSLTGIEPSSAFLQHAQARIADSRAKFLIGDAQSLPMPAQSVDCVVSGLVLNFVPDPQAALAEIVRVVRPGGVAAVYVWDYADKMEMMRYFWNAAVALDPAAQSRDEGQRFPICRPEALAVLFRNAGLRDVQTRPIDIVTRFADFDDYWNPFLSGQGPAPSYAVSLSEDRLLALRDEIRTRLPIAGDGSIALIARAWAAQGYR